VLFDGVWPKVNPLDHAVLDLCLQFCRTKTAPILCAVQFPNHEIHIQSPVGCATIRLHCAPSTSVFSLQDFDDALGAVYAHPVSSTQARGSISAVDYGRDTQLAGDDDRV